jgi:uncharacterized protein YjbI with pentapeptide repeats
VLRTAKRIDNAKLYNAEYYNAKLYNAKYHKAKHYNAKYHKAKHYNAKHCYRREQHFEFTPFEGA